MNLTDIEFMKYVQEHLSVPLEDLEQHLDKNQSTILRSMKKINELMGDFRFLVLKKNRVMYQQAYTGYEHFMHRLSFRNYRPSQSERVRLLVMHLILSGEVRKKALYERLGISISTLKNDKEALHQLLEKYALKTNIMHRKGTEITGNELSIRVMLANIIFDCIELSDGLQPDIHPATTPVNRELAAMFLTSCRSYIEQALSCYYQLIRHYGLTFSYNSKKYLIVYLCLSLKRKAEGSIISELKEDDLINTLSFSLFEDDKENRAVNQIVSTSTISNDGLNCYDAMLTEATYRLIDGVCRELKGDIVNRRELFCQLYELLKVSLSRVIIGVNIIDRKTDGVLQEQDSVSGVVCCHISTLEKNTGTQINNAVRSNIVMIFRRFLLQNRTTSKQRTRVCVVSNSSQEKILYFIEKLKLHYHIEYVKLVNSNEVDALCDSEYDLLLTFTNKISSYLEKIGKPYTKLSFELSESDIALLNSLHLPRAARKISLEEFVENLGGRSADELRYQLRTQYPEHFI